MSVRVRVVAQTMTRGDGVTVLGLVGVATVRRETFASMSTLAQLVFQPELSVFSQASAERYTLVRAA